MQVIKEDLIETFQGREDFEEIKEKIEALDEGKMRWLSNKVTDAVTEYCYWDFVYEIGKQVLEIET